MFSCFASAPEICSSVTNAFSTKTRPSLRPVRFCSPNENCSCSSESNFCCTRISPRRTFSGLAIHSPYQENQLHLFYATKQTYCDEMFLYLWQKSVIYTRKLFR